MCSDPLGCTIGVWDIAPLVFIAAGRYIGFLKLKK